MTVLDVYSNYVKMKLPFDVNVNGLKNVYVCSMLTLAEICGRSVFHSYHGMKYTSEFYIMLIRGNI